MQHVRLRSSGGCCGSAVLQRGACLLARALHPIGLRRHFGCDAITCLAAWLRQGACQLKTILYLYVVIVYIVPAAAFLTPAVAALALRVRKHRLALPLGLLQLRPPPPPKLNPPPVLPRAAATPYDGTLGTSSSADLSSTLPPASDGNAAGSLSGEAHASSSTVSSSSGGGSTGSDASSAALAAPPQRQPAAAGGPAAFKYRNAASEGSDACADEHYPPLRRAQRLSYAAAICVMDLTPGEGRQAVLEAGSVSARLRLVLMALVKHRKVLSAVAAVRGLADNNRDPPL